LRTALLLPYSQRPWGDSDRLLQLRVCGDTDCSDELFQRLFFLHPLRWPLRKRPAHPASRFHPDRCRRRSSRMHAVPQCRPYHRAATYPPAMVRRAEKNGRLGRRHPRRQPRWVSELSDSELRFPKRRRVKARRKQVRIRSQVVDRVVTGICPVQPSGARQARGGEALEEAKRCRPNARSGHYGSAAVNKLRLSLA